MLPWFAFVFIVFFAGPGVQAQIATADSAVYKLFASLKNNDEQAFRALYPGVPQIVRISRRSTEKMLKIMRPHSGQAKEMLLSMTDDARAKDVIRNMNLDSSLSVEMNGLPDDLEKGLNSPKGQAEIKRMFSQAFKKMLAAGESKGVRWQNAKLLSFQMDSTFTGLIKVWGELFLGDPAIQSVGGVINFRSDESDYKARVRNIFYVPEDSCWFGGEITEVIRTGETFNEANRTNFLPAGRSESETADSLEAAKILLADTAEAPSSPPPVKSKTQSGNTKKKTPTKSPARKPATKA